MDEFVTVALLSELETKRALKVTLEGRDIAVLQVEGEIYALDDRCPHKGGPLSAGWVEDGAVFCPLHGWKFNLKTGACETNCERPIQTHEVRIRENEVQIRCGRESSASG